MTTTHTTGSGDDLLHYDVHGDLSEASLDQPALLAFANPMEAEAFGARAEQISDRPVVTIDPRGAARGVRAVTPGVQSR